MKKKLSLFALVAVLVMAFTGSAFAATMYVWKGDATGSGNWGEAGNWVNGIAPVAANTADIAVFPATTGNVIINADASIGGIHVDSGADVVFSIGATKIFGIAGLATDNSGANVSLPSVTLMQGANLRIEGAGELHLTNQQTAMGGALETIAPAGNGAWFDVAEGAVIDVAVRMDTKVAVTKVIKHGKGTLAFTSTQANLFGILSHPVIIRDGEIQIARADHLGVNTLGINKAYVTYDTAGVPGRTATLTTTWANSQTLVPTDTPTERIIAAATTGSAILNISVEGSTLVLDKNTAGNVPALQANAKSVTKKGLGTLLLASTGVWEGEGSTLNMTEGFTVVDANNALAAPAAPVLVLVDDIHVLPQVNVAIGEGTKLTLNKTFWQAVRATTGKGTLQLLESSEWDITRNCEFAGVITGAGNLAIGTLYAAGAGRLVVPGLTSALPDLTVFISGQNNDYTGDTQVYRGAKLQVNHEKNLGGTKLGKLYLEALNAVPTATTALESPFARFELVDSSSFIMPNEVYIGIGASRNAGGIVDSRPLVGGAVVIVPIDTRLEIANNITFNRNALIKAGEGEIFFSSIGYDSQGDGTFRVEANGAANVPPNNGPITTALHIINGKARIENERALNLGDITVDRGGFVATRPVLSIRNGLKMTNSIQFTNQSSFQTELIDANLSEGTNVASAVEVGKVFYCTDYTIAPNATTPATGVVYNRVAFDELTAGTISKGNDFQLMKATSYTNYDAPKVEPYEWDGQVKAPFDPYFSLTYLYFKATHNIDVPVFGAANVSEVKPGEGYTITIPVTSETGLKAASETLFNLPGATIQISGNSLVITGNAPALLEGQEYATYTYRASVHTMGNVPNSILGYEGYKEYTLKVTPNPGGNTPAGPVISTPTVTKTDDKVSVATTVAVDDVAQAGVEVTFTLTNAAGEVIATEKATTDGHGAASAEFDISELADGDYTITTSADGYAAKTSSFRIGDVPIDPPVDGGSSSGCDAGFGAFALLALGAAVVLRKKD